MHRREFVKMSTLIHLGSNMWTDVYTNAFSGRKGGVPR